MSEPEPPENSAGEPVAPPNGRADHDGGANAAPPRKPDERALLRKRFDELRAVYREANGAVHSRLRLRFFLYAWLAEVGVSLAQLERQIVQIEAAAQAPPTMLNSAWQRYWKLYGALAPVGSIGLSDTTDDESRRSTTDEPRRPLKVDLRPVANRLTFVYLFLLVQILLAIGVLSYSVYLFSQFDPQTALTRQQWAARAPARANLERLRLLIDHTAKQPRAASTPSTASAATSKAAPPQTPSGAKPAGGAAPSEQGPTAKPTREEAAAHGTDDAGSVILRSEIEGLAAALADLPLAQSDLKLANAWLDNLLTMLDAEPVDYARLSALVVDLQRMFGTDTGKAPPSVVFIIVLGSLLGMLTITIHLNWKFRNQWDTAGFVPWYATKLVAAPVLSLASAGFLAQVRFTMDQDAITAETNTLGLLGAPPLLIFAVAIVTGLFSNLFYDWLRDTATRVTTTRAPARPDPAEQPQGGAGAPSPAPAPQDA